MKILCIYPFLDLDYNSIAQSILYLGAQGHEVKVITVRKAVTTKGGIESEPVSEYHNVTIYRPFESFKEQFSASEECVGKALACVGEFRPDLVYCSLQHNMKLARKLSAHFKVPLVLLVEFARDPARLLPWKGMGLMKRWGLSWILTPAARLYWRSLVNSSDAVMVTNPADKRFMEEMAGRGKDATYVPWCTQVPELDPGKRMPCTALHAGGLIRMKNAGALAPAMEILLNKTPTEHFIVVGRGRYGKAVRGLVKRYPGRVTYHEELPREKVLELIAEAGYAFLPAREGALAFIGDCWGLKLPLVSLYNPAGLLVPGKDAIVTNGMRGLADSVNRLLEDPRLGNRIADAAHERYLAQNTAESVGSHFEKVYKRVLERRPSGRSDKTLVCSAS